MTDYQLAKEVSSTLKKLKSITINPETAITFRKYLRDFKGTKEFVTKTTLEGLTITRLK